MFKQSVLALCIIPLRLHAQAVYPTEIVDYRSGAGFAAGYTNPSAALGEPARSTPGPFPVDPFNPPYLSDQLVSIGATGSIIVRFPSPIADDRRNPGGIDFLIFGNAGFVITNGDFGGGGITDGTLFGQNPGATRVSVSVDGLAYFRLNPGMAPVVDGYFPTDGSGDFSVPVNPSLSLSSFAGKDLAGIRSLYGGSGGGTGFDIEWARDASGQPLSLGAISFVRVDVDSGHSEIDAFAAVPEPGSVILTSVALAAAGVVRSAARRKSKGSPHAP